MTTIEQRQDDFELELDVLGEVVMAVNKTDRGTVGCAYYVAREEKLYFMEDAQMGGADIVDSCGCHLLPTTLHWLTLRQ